MNMNNVVVLDYGLGNVLSVLRAIEYNGFKAKISNLKEDIKDCTHLVIPGVGSFCDAIKVINQDSLKEMIINHANKGFPILGICLGMQLLADIGYEGGINKGLGLIQGKVKKLPEKDILTNNLLKVPNIGWRNVKSQEKTDNELFDEFTNNKQYYHVHSYHFVTSKKENIIGISKFGSYDIVVGVQKGNIFGTQFHPEKSGEDGLKLLKNFLELKF